MIKHHGQKQLGEERVYFTHHEHDSSLLKAVRAGTYREQEPEAGADAEALEECC